MRGRQAAPAAGSNDVNGAARWAVGAVLPLAMANLACQRQPRPPEIRSAADLPAAMAWALEGVCRFEPALAPGVGGCDCGGAPAPGPLATGRRCDPPPPPGSEPFERLQAISPAMRALATDASANSSVAAAIWPVAWSDSVESALESRDRLLEVASSGESEDVASALLGMQMILSVRAQSARELFVAQEMTLRATPAVRALPTFEANRIRLSEWLKGPAQSDDPELGRIDRCSSRRREAEESAFDSWPRAELAADSESAAAELWKVVEAGRRLSSTCGDTYFESFARSVRALAGDERPAVARALLIFRDALRDYARYQLDASRARFELALSGLRGRVPVVALEAELFLAASEYQLGEIRVAEKRARRLESEDLAELPTLAGRLQWTLGTFAAWRARPLEAVEHYRRASEAYRECGDVTGFATAEAFVAELMAQFGDLEQAATLALGGLRVVDRVDDPRRKMNIYYSAALVAEAAGAPHVSRARFSEAVEAIRGSGQDIALATGLVGVARLSRQIGETRESRMIANEALALVPIARIDAGARLMRADAHLALWDVYESTEDAERALDEAEATYAALDIEKGVLEVRLARLRLRARTDGSFHRAAVELALDGLSREFAGLELESRIRTAGARRLLVDALIERSLANGDPLFALALDQWDRAWLQTATPKRLARSWDELTLTDADLDGARAVVVFRQLGDRWLRWVWNRSQWRAEILETGVEATARRIARLRDALRESALETARREAIELRELLLPPIAADARNDVLVAVLDGVLWRAPVASWGASRRGVDGAAPWLRLALQLRSPGGSTPSSSRRHGVGLVGYPNLDGRFGLPPLDHDRREMVAIQSRFGSRVDLFVGDSATSRSATAALASKRLVHFVTHMTAGGETGELAMLLLSAAAGDAEPSGLTAEHLRTMDLAGLELVVLAGCSSAIGATPGLGESSSLAATLLYAGAERVIGTLWDIDDQDAASVASRLYAELSLEPISDGEIDTAFRNALTASLEAGASDAAAFQLIRRHGLRTAGDEGQGARAVVDEPAHLVSLDEGGER